MDNIMFSIYCNKPKNELKLLIKKLKQDYIHAKRKVNNFYNKNRCYDMEDVLSLNNIKNILESAEKALRYAV